MLLIPNVEQVSKKRVTIQTGEHVLAALVGCEIDNVLIELNF